MVVVAITGLLASLGFASLRSQVKAAWSAEAISTVQAIRAAEERWRTEYMMYVNVSQPTGLWYPGSPISDPGEQRPFFFAPGSGEHPNQEAWLALRPSVAGPARFGYLVNAGVTGEVMTVPSAGSAITWPIPVDNWYVIQAIGDTDGDGVLSYYRASSLNGEVFVENPGE